MITTDAFLGLANQVASELQIPAARIAVVAHPIGGTPEAELHARAEAACGDLRELLSAE